LAQLRYTRRALADLERLTDFLLEDDPSAAMQTAELISEAVQVLKNHPCIGRPAGCDIRELIISRGSTGYVALYSYEEPVTWC
jgi:addiction module RelE/StbE family toxin